MIRVFVADDHAVVRDGLARILDAVPDMAFAGAAESASELFAAMPEARIDVLILDLSGLGEAGGVDVLERIRQAQPKLPVIIYSMYPEEEYGVRLLQAGAMAYLSKSRSTELLLEAIRKVASGVRFITDPIARRLIESGGRPQVTPLTTRELQIMQLLVEGRQTSQIAAALAISPSTVSTHLRNIKDKLDVDSIAQIVRRALRDGLVE